MAPDLLSTINREIDERLRELRPLVAEHERLLGAADALVGTGREGSTAVANAAAPATRTRRKTRVGVGRRGSAAVPIELAATGSSATPGDGQLDEGFAKGFEASAGQPAAAPRKSPATRKSPAKLRPARAVRGAAREAILAALGHGSHTVGELAVVTAMSGPNISGNVRKLVSEGAVVKIEREGKAAWTLADVTT